MQQKVYNISSNYLGEDAGVTILLDDIKTKKCYEIVLKNIEDVPGVKEWFDNLKDLFLHIKKQENYQINYEQKSIQIRGKHPTKPNTYLQIAIIKFNPRQSGLQINKSYTVQQIMKICTSSQPLSDQKIKKMFMTLAQNAKGQSIVPGHINKQYDSIMNNKKQEMDKYINKIQQQFQINVEKINKEAMRMFKETSSKLIGPNQNKKQKNQEEESVIFQKLQSELKSKDDIFDAIINKMTMNFESRDLRLEKLYDRLDQIQGKLLKLSEEITQIEKTEGAENFIDRTCYSYQRVFVEGKTIKKIRGNEADIFLKTKIKDKNRFSILIQNLTKTMCVGVADANLKSRESFVNQPNCVVIYNDGNFYNGATLRGKVCQGFTKGDILHVAVNTQLGKIEWHVDNQLRLSYNYDRLKNDGIQWRPYVWMIQNGASFSIMQ